jgi:hypothetical protein
VVKIFDYSTLKALEVDYEIMRTEMIYGNSSSFADIIKVVTNLQDEINNTQTS